MYNHDLSSEINAQLYEGEEGQARDRKPEFDQLTFEVDGNIQSTDFNAMFKHCMVSTDTKANTFEEIRKECTTLEKPSSMCKDLDIKIAIMQRYWDNVPYSMVSMLPMVSALLGVEVSYGVMRYVCLTTKDQIIHDIVNEVPIALELDNLKLNWN
jgi:hypothetical protein